MQVKKIYLDFAFKNNSKLIECFDKRNIFWEFVSINQNILKKIENSGGILLLSESSMVFSDELNLKNISAKLENIPVIVLYKNETDLNFSKFKSFNVKNYFEHTINPDILINFIDSLGEEQKIRFSNYQNSENAEQNMICYKNLFHAINTGIITLDNNFNILKVNDFTNKMFKNEQISNLKEIIFTDIYDDFVTRITDFKNSNENHRSFETYAINLEGNIFPMEVDISKIFQFDTTYFVIVIYDISKQVQQQNEINELIEEMQINRDMIEQNASEQIMLNSKLYEQQEELEILNASKDKFFSIIAHDLKTPFQSLLGYSEILSKDIKQMDDDEISMFAHHLNESAQKLFKLLENLLHWSRIQRGGISYNPEYLDLYLISELNIDLIISRAKEKNISVKNKIIPATQCYGDTNIINTIIRNLLSNAVKFTKQKGTITLESEIQNNYCYLHIIDDGVGMSEEDMEKIFKIDKHHTTPGTSNEEGTGLGLILCYELAQKNEGELTVSSQKEIGSEFTLKIPLHSTKNQ